VKLSKLKGIYPIIFITLVVFVSVALVTWADSITKAQIKYQQEQEIQGMLKEMFPDMSQYTLEDDIYIIYSDGAEVGYAFLAVGKGYGGEISILVGLEDEATLKGITVISQSETPGLGSRIAESAFANAFAGVSIDDVALRQEGGQIDAITGATISSRAVVDAVRTTAMEKVKALKERK
jgi:electron transport complex protein RnfG